MLTGWGWRQVANVGVWEVGDEEEIRRKKDEDGGQVMAKVRQASWNGRLRTERR